MMWAKLANFYLLRFFFSQTPEIKTKTNTRRFFTVLPKQSSPMQNEKSANNLLVVVLLKVP